MGSVASALYLRSSRTSFLFAEFDKRVSEAYGSTAWLEMVGEAVVEKRKEMKAAMEEAARNFKEAEENAAEYGGCGGTPSKRRRSVA